MSFGRASGIVSDWDVPLPRRSANDTPSYDAFVSLCELAGIMNDFVLVLSPGASSDGRARLARLLTVGLDLDRWRGRLDARGFFDYPGVKPPGLCECLFVLVSSNADPNHSQARFSSPSTPLAKYSPFVPLLT